MKKILIFMVIFSLQLMSCFEYGQFGGPERFAMVEFDTSEIINFDTIDFTINKLATGNHTLEMSFVPIDVNIFGGPSPPPPVMVKFRIEIEKKGKIKKTDFLHALGKETSNCSIYLYNIPKDFLWDSKGNLLITIRDISFDDSFTQYYKTVRFSVKRHSLLFEGDSRLAIPHFVL
ncbi:MAG: hypothetical protein LBQ46_01960 [Treponema sp.]|nr:hypothetical protein [Treponema sp.]